MSIFDNVKIIYHPVAHGEMNFIKIERGNTKIKFDDNVEHHADGSFIIGHSEQGHHHLLENNTGTLVRSGTEEGMKILHVIVKNPSRIYQDAANPHETQMLDEGEYIIIPSRSFDPLTQQARRVMD